ncbi:alpha/beta fold hydrolase [Hymenobacter chitinivorans]|uniref:Pimeloyl-ACP methyl ester carboxylesterase n=1 Tax=Hymenobacter chitinivorans DSM 11115 TaxID=1121954 RepID=A0A2M9BSF9_9BACT|nr:alpha/beta fold hydrolase [Hymenobacter chitinivorans]PJJ60873.1 pimeloyl-ACP methyl ester carboxylesterase [Hymenobacter chitinivorans DSM 11115]
MKENLLLLHGALGSDKQLRGLARDLSQYFQVHTFSFSGHGGREIEPAQFNVPAFAQEVIGYLREQNLEAVHVFGYSMGGYVALLAAAEAPGLIKTVTTLGTKFDWSAETLAAETRMLDAATMQEKVPQFAEQLAQTHAPTDWKAVVQATRQLLTALSEQPPLTPARLTKITVPVQILVGELDKTAGVDASSLYASYLPQATFEILMNTPHPLERVNPDELGQRIRRFSAGAA